MSAAIGIHTALWLAFALFIASIAILLAVPAVPRLRRALATLVEPARHRDTSDAPWPD